MVDCQTWPEPVIRVQALAESGLTRIPACFIKPHSQRPTFVANSQQPPSEADNINIPVIDLQHLSGSNQEETLRQVSEACRERGFFQVVNHGVSHELMESAREVWREFFHLPLEAKEEYANSPTTYEGYGSRLRVKKGAIFYEGSIPWEADFAILISALLVVVQLHYQGSSPLRSHPAEMWTFMSCLLTYCIARRCYMKSQISSPAATHGKLCFKVALISGSLASAALISVLVPRFLEPIVFIICLMFLFIYFAGNPILDMGQKAFSYVKRNWEKITGSRDEPATIVRV